MARTAISLILATSIACILSCKGTEVSPGIFGIVQAENSVGRHGAYYLPSDYRDAPLPVMVYFHGTNGDGAHIVSDLAWLAEARRFVLVAPDSRIAPDGRYSWQVGRPGSPTEDFDHARAVLAEVLAIDGVELDPRYVLAAGHSGGAGSGPYLATNDDRFTACAVLHGGIFTGSIGPNTVPVFFATGEDDTFRTPEHVQGHVDDMRALPGFADLVTYTIYPGGHQVSDQEAMDLVDWWYGRPW